MTTEVLLKTIAHVESDNGRNSYPNFEPSFAPNGERFVVEGRIVSGTGRNFNSVVKPRWDRWGMSSACSFSRWQILYHTAADLGYDGPPWELWDDATAEPFVRERMQRILNWGAATPEQVADAWNSGTFKDRFVPEAYIRRFMQVYETLKRADLEV